MRPELLARRLLERRAGKAGEAPAAAPAESSLRRASRAAARELFGDEAKAGALESFARLVRSTDEDEDEDED